MILYAKGETQFNHLGLGILSDAVKAVVTEERNGAFYLDLEYPIGGVLFDQIEMESIIKADAGHKSPDQLFFVSRIEAPIRGTVKIYAQHVSRKAEKNQLEGDVIGSGTAAQAIQTWIDNLVDKSDPWSAYSDKDFTSSFSWLVQDTDNAMRVLGGQSGSVLQVYRGEYEFDNWDIRLWTNRGRRADTLIAYGRNLVDLIQEEMIVDTITSVYPFVYREEEEETTLITLPESVIHSSNVDNFASPKIMKLDLSDKEEIDTVEKLRSEALAYMERNNVGVPKVSIRLKHQDLSQVMGYEDAPQEEIGLCDTVAIRFEKLGIHTEAKVVAVKWNVLLERYDELTFGDTSKTLAQAIGGNIDSKIEKIRDEAIRYARISADGKNKVYQGELEPPIAKDGDLWFKPEGTDTAMYRYEDGAWIRVIGTGDEIDAGRITIGTLDAAQVNVINIDANNISAGKVSANLIEIDSQTSSIDEDDNLTTVGARFAKTDNSISLKVTSEVTEQLSDPDIQDLFKGEDGQDGVDGISVGTVTAHYYLSTSPSVLSGGSWSTT